MAVKNPSDVAYEILEKRINSNEALIKLQKDDARALKENHEKIVECIIRAQNENNALKEALKVLNPTRSSVREALENKS